MYLRDMNPVKLGQQIRKIPFIFNYFEKEMLLKKDYGSKLRTQSSPQQYIVIERHIIKMDNYTELDIDFWGNTEERMSKRITIDYNLRIEDQDDCLIVDFANAFIGGGTLGKGAAQEEILFLIFPQAIISMLICEKMDYNESIYIHNIRRYADYLGYTTSLEFQEMPNESFYKNIRKDFIAMDAIQYFDGKTDSQFKLQNILTELNKCFIAFSPIELCKYDTISSGKWGCGAFKGDPQLKFLIQWIAVSIVNRPLIFATLKDLNRLEKLPQIIKTLGNKEVKDVFGYLVKYSNGFQEFNLFDSILKMVEEDEFNEIKSKQREKNRLFKME
ncbi:poly(adp-ribose) glycohydrolase 1-like [Stylonychia lemnae]|uniref:Poly(Adp-ribose) glycohydrolase 1-like n=1 Tax=Stylonychia lemnae TaxID=5949 RepID=A0A078A9M1_STYLE|nr:poly(adp-ribose) glycohydrolase 1-like [Stylonychia lemnae]|eukprot:CDW78970.1 poly(adp-ribose) glycohydrolase 1-like [Stylonychia lemnae]